MTPQEAKKMLKAKLECLKRETSGTDIDCNHRNCDECNLCYEQDNMGEQKEALEMAIKALERVHIMSEEEFEAYLKDEDLVVVKRKILKKALEQQPKTGHWITDVYMFGRGRHTCSNCGKGQEYTTAFCSWCGADMRGEKNGE